MSLLNILIILLLTGILSVAVASSQPVVEQDSLSILVVNTIKQSGTYAPLPLKHAADEQDRAASVEVRPIPVETISINILESFPVQVHVLVKGYFPNGCFRQGETDISRENKQFRIVINMSKLSTLMACTQALVPFETVVALDVYGLHAGTYQVDVNGIRKSFALSVDNF